MLVKKKIKIMTVPKNKQTDIVSNRHRTKFCVRNIVAYANSIRHNGPKTAKVNGVRGQCRGGQDKMVHPLIDWICEQFGHIVAKSLGRETQTEKVPIKAFAQGRLFHLKCYNKKRWH